MTTPVSQTSLTPPAIANEWQWTPTRRRAAEMTADGSSIRDISNELNLNPKTIQNWRKCDPFWDYIAEIQKQMERQALGLTIASRLKRLEILDELKQDILRVKDERGHSAADDPEMHMDQDADRPLVPGAETGLVVHQLKTVGSGPNAQIVHEYGVDYNLPKAVIELDRQATKELGQDAPQRVTHEGDPNKPIEFTITIDKPRGQMIDGEFRDA